MDESHPFPLTKSSLASAPDEVISSLWREFRTNTHVLTLIPFHRSGPGIGDMGLYLMKTAQFGVEF